MNGKLSVQGFHKGLSFFTSFNVICWISQEQDQLIEGKEAALTWSLICTVHISAAHIQLCPYVRYLPA